MKEHEYLVRIYNKGGLVDEYTVYDWGECQDVLWNTLYGEEDGHYAKIYEDGRYIGKVTPSMMVKENTNTNMNKKTIRLTESDLHRIIKESTRQILKENSGIRFNWSITVAPQYAKKMYDLQSKLQNAKWVMDFESDSESTEMQQLSIKPMGESRLNENGFYPKEWDSRTQQYLEGDAWEDFDEMSMSELKALQDKYLAQIGHTPMNKLANTRPDVLHALKAIENEIADRHERYECGDKYALD